MHFIRTDHGAKLPTRESTKSPKYDLYALETAIIRYGHFGEAVCTVRTGVGVDLPEGTVGILTSCETLALRGVVQPFGTEIVVPGNLREIHVPLTYRREGMIYRIDPGTIIASLVVTLAWCSQPCWDR